MSVGYRPVQWNRNKYVYDAVVLAAVVAYIWLFMYAAPQFLEVRPVETPIRRMRAFGTCAFLLLTFVLCIGPLARLDGRFLPLLYNRRHLGVITFMVALGHVLHVLDWYYAFSPFDSHELVLGANTAYASWHGFPFEALGLAALVILFVMAATSHDFWLAFLTPPLWKTIHMGVYLAYGLIVMHVTLGLLQTETHPFYAAITGGGFALVAGLHLAAGLKEARADGRRRRIASAGMTDWVEAGRVGDIAPDCAIVVALPKGERVAVFRYEDRLSALSNVCAHQNGPLGEGRIVDGCVTCPWHGFQYRPDDGRSPPPFTEKVATYRLALDGDRILIDPAALPPGTRVPPTVLPESLR